MLQQLSDRLFYLPYSHDTDRPNLGYIRGSRYALMFDAGASPRHVKDFQHSLREKNLPDPDFSAVSHWHWDHTFGMCALSMPVIAGSLTDERLTDMSRWQWDRESMNERVGNKEDIPFAVDMMRKEYGDTTAIRVRNADIVFEHSLTLALGGLTCKLMRIGGPHSDDSVIAYVPEEKFVFLSDSPSKDLMNLDWTYDPEHLELLYDIWRRLPYDETKLEKYLAILERLDFENCLTGHAPPMTKRDLFITLNDKPPCSEKK